MPKKKRKEATTTKAYVASLNGSINSFRVHGLGVGGRRDLTVKLE